MPLTCSDDLYICPPEVRDAEVHKVGCGEVRCHLPNAYRPKKNARYKEEQEKAWDAKHSVRIAFGLLETT